LWIVDGHFGPQPIDTGTQIVEGDAGKHDREKPRSHRERFTANDSMKHRHQLTRLGGGAS